MLRSAALIITLMVLASPTVLHDYVIHLPSRAPQTSFPQPIAARRILKGYSVRSIDPVAASYCRISHLRSKVPLDGPLKIIEKSYDQDEDHEAGRLYLIRSIRCPEGLYSMIRVDRFDRIREEMDCRTERPERILLRTEQQGDIREDPPLAGKLRLAISGPGYFVMRCRDGDYLTRLGLFDLRDGMVVSGGCRLMDSRGRGLRIGTGPIDQRGCTTDGTCVAVVEAQPDHVQWATAWAYRATLNPYLNPIINPFVFHGAHESLVDSNGRHRTMDWIAVPKSTIDTPCDH